MATIASLLIHLGIDTRDVKRETDKVPAQTEAAGHQAGSRFAAGFKSGVGKIARVAAGIATSVVVAMGTIATTGAGIGIKTAAGMQQAQIGFSTLLKDGQKAQAFLAELQAFAAKTPFEFPGVRDAARQLLGVGQAANTVIPTLTAFGDAAGALGLSQEQFERAMLATTQAISKGKFQAEEILQITEAGIPVWPLLSRAMGKPVAELQKMAEQGKLVAKDVLPKLEAQMRKDYGGSMAKQSQTLTGLWSTLTDTVNMGLGRAILPLTPALGRAAGAATTLADKGLAKLTEFMETTGGPAVDRFVAKVEAMFAGGGGGVVQTAKDIGAAIQAMFAGVDKQGAGESMASIGDSLTKLAPLVKELLAQLPSLNDLLDVSAAVLKFAADHVDELAAALPYLVAAIVAYKVAQFASNVATAAAIPLRILEYNTNRKLLASNQALLAATRSQTAAVVASSAATRASTVAENAGILTRIRSTASLVAYRVASVAVRAATIAWTAVQWALNVALTANPIGVVVVAIATLVAAIIYAYTQSETFRKIVQVAFQATFFWIKLVAGFVVNTAWPWLRDTFNKVADLVVDLYHTWRSWLDRAVGFVAALPGRIRSAARGLFDGVVAAAKGGINTVIDTWNRLDFAINIRVPDWVPGVGGKGFSVPDIFPDIPMLAEGGIVPATPGGRLLVAAEGGEDEAVAPVSRLTGMVRSAVREGLGGGSGAGITVENLNVRAYSNQFRLSQVMTDLAMHGVH